jgi:hypothetical protein
MKRKLNKLKALVVALISTAYTFAGTSYVQVFHNCADPLADTVSVFVDFGSGQAPLLPAFAFRTATPFVSVPSDTTFTVHIKAKGSNAGSPSLYTKVFGPLAGDSSYLVVASGVVGSGFASNPDGVSTAFDLKVLAPARQASFNAGTVDFAVFHGSTDAPGVDINLSAGSTLVAAAKYADASGYLSVPPTWYPIDIAVAGTSTVVASYVADLSTLSGGAAVVFASGFLTPSANNNGPAFGLYAVLASGTVLALPLQEKAGVQVLHNCADPAADSVDVYINGSKALDNFAFRTSTPFIQLIAGYPNQVAIAPKTSSSVADAVWQQDYTLTANTNYILTASGTIGTGFSPNPDGKSIAFAVLVKAQAQTQAVVNTNFDFFAIHGVTDAPSVDVVGNGALTLVDNASYTDQTTYLAVPVSNYILSVRDSSGTNTIQSYVADVTTLAGSSGVVLASGFLNPASNNNGSPFGLFLVLPSGGAFIPLDVYTSVKDFSKEIGLQVSPNPSSGFLDVNFEAQQEKDIEVQITDLNGKVVMQTLAAGNLQGKQRVTLDLNSLTNGMYLTRIITADKSYNSKFTLMR